MMFIAKEMSESGDSYYAYPVIKNETGCEGALPVYLHAIGKTKCERHVIRDHGYSHPQIIYTVAGEGTLVIDGESYKIPQNMGFYLPANAPHKYFSSGDVDWETRWVAMGGFAIENLFTELGLDNPRMVLIGNSAKLDKLFNEMYYSLTRDEYYGSMYAAGSLYSFILEFFKFAKSNGDPTVVKERSPMTKILDYIDSHYAEELTLEKMCEASLISPQHLCRLFRKKLNCRPMEYVAKKRIQEAKVLLANSPRNIAEIAKLVGYNNCNYFCITFKKYEGMSPTQYRKTMG
ncbi:MAG: AraC family transcriptional regulator [Ruminococcus sp.]|nr:AraC family transcriptional regulator [Ruminococcus sp.]